MLETVIWSLLETAGSYALTETCQTYLKCNTIGHRSEASGAVLKSRHAHTLVHSSSLKDLCPLRDSCFCK